MPGEESMAPYAAEMARRLRERNARYAVMPVDDVVDASELVLVEIARVAEGADAGRLDRHLRRVAQLRVDQHVSAADIGEAFEEVRLALAKAPVDGDAIWEIVDRTEARMLSLLRVEESRQGI